MEITREHLTQAIKLSIFWHHNQYDDSGMPYILHVLRVMDKMRRLGFAHMVVAVLHDTVEDTDLTNNQIRTMFGDEIADAVEAITHLKNEPYKDYLKRVKDNRYALAVKVEDIHDNMRFERLQELPLESRERRIRKYMMALLYLSDNQVHIKSD